jgi:hypothetical protein
MSARKAGKATPGVVQALWLANSDKDERDHQIQAAISAMFGVQSRDELEGMLGAQMITTHTHSFGDLRLDHDGAAEHPGSRSCACTRHRSHSARGLSSTKPSTRLGPHAA